MNLTVLFEGMIQLFSMVQRLKNNSNNIESQYLQNRNTHRIAIHIESPPKYRDSIVSGGPCRFPSLLCSPYPLVSRA